MNTPALRPLTRAVALALCALIGPFGTAQAHDNAENAENAGHGPRGHGHVPHIVFDTHTLPSAAQPAQTPGSPGVVVSHPKLLAQFGAAERVNLNQVRYTRYTLSGHRHRQPDAILVAVPGTLAASHSYLILAENLALRMWRDHGLIVELWGVDRRSVQLQDMAGLNLAERERDPRIALDWLYGKELNLPLNPKLTRRAEFYDSTDVAFMAHWTPQVHSQDIDAIVERARRSARHGNVFLGGHSAGTGFVARYAATDFNLSGAGAPQPGHAKLRGLVLLEGPGGAVNLTPPTPAQLDAVIAAAEGGLYNAVAAGSVQAFVSRPGLTPRVNAATEVTGLQIAVEKTLNGSQALLQQDQGGVPGNSVYKRVPGFADRPFPVTAGASIGTFMDDDQLARTVFYSVSIGALGAAPNANGLMPWLDSNEALPATALRDFGPEPMYLVSPLAPWGKEVEATRLMRLSRAFYAGHTTYSDWYYPSSGLLIGNDATVGGANLGLDTSALSLPVAQGGRGRSDIVNQTQARKIDVPVIAFGGSNGLTPSAGVWRAFAQSIAPCAAASCTPGVARTTDNATEPPPLPPRTFGGAAGGFEVYISEGYTHVDVLTANDDANNKVVQPLAAFIARNVAVNAPR